ncbi:MAG: hypothetical protein ACTSQI_07145 [Candidatus Helarchaeota archaeon]
MIFISGPINSEAQELTESALKHIQGTQFPNNLTERAVLGFDGYLDTIISVVRVRHSPSSYDLMESLSEWAERITQSAGSSASMECITKKISVGGFTSNLGRALSTLCGRVENVHLIGAYGTPKLHEVFRQQLLEFYKCVLFPVNNPGVTNAYEFADGKIMMVNFENINNLDWAKILAGTGRDFLIEEYDQSRLWGIGYWASSPHMSDFFTQLQDTIFPNLSKPTKEKYLLLDLSDVSKKPHEQILELKGLLPRFEEYARVVLSLNDLELNKLGAALFGSDLPRHTALNDAIRKRLNISTVISHHPQIASISTENTRASIINTYTPTPRFTTAAGDHFNGGVSYGLLLNLPAEVLPLIGNAVASLFVRTGASPTSGEVQQFLSQYNDYLAKEKSL